MKITFMRSLTYYSLLLCGVLFTACSDINPAEDNIELSKSYNYQLNIEAEAAADTQAQPTGTRSLSEDAAQKLHSIWEQGDELLAYNLSDNDQSTEHTFSLLASESKATSSDFWGTLKSKNAVKATDDLCFLYPGASTTGSNKVITSVIKKQQGSGANAIIYHEQQATIKKLLLVDMTNQDGSITTIGKRFDLQWAKVKPKRVNGSQVEVKVGKMQRKIALLGLRFASETGQALTNIDKVVIYGLNVRDVFDLGTGQFITGNKSDESDELTITPSTGKLTSAGGKYTYVAVMPGNYSNIAIMAYVGNKCYMQFFKRMNLTADKVFRKNVLGMSDHPAPQPYVEVQGVKWATGNFIHYKEAGSEYWGIAPTQWWLSQYAVTSNGKLVSSQFLRSPNALPDDLDMFRYGDIWKALNVNHSYYKQGSINISKKFYYNSGPLQPEVSRSNAFYGDIVWYYTMSNNQKYRMANETEFTTLLNQANAIAGYCVTERGTKVYGAYFTTHENGTKRVNDFPVGAQAFAKYKDVTQLVKANRGLFLPMGGRCADSNDKIGFRDMEYNEIFGRYLTSECKVSLHVRCFSFGSAQFSITGLPKGESSCLRPVWDESSTSSKDAMFGPFKNRF